MTVIERPGRLEIIFSLPDDKRRTESVLNIRPTATDNDLYDIGVAISNLLADTLYEIRRTSSKAYAA